MGSSTHLQGNPQKVSLISQRNTIAVLERLRERHADNRWVIYVRALGRGLDLVKNFCNDQPYRVANVTGRTFTPGSVVMLGSHAAHPGEVIIAGPPPNAGGASRVGTAFFNRTRPEIPEPPTPPEPPTSIPMVGIRNDGSTLHAYTFNADGTLRDTLPTIPKPTGFSTFGAGLGGLMEGPVVACKLAGSSTTNPWLVWDLIAGTYAIYLFPLVDSAGQSMNEWFGYGGFWSPTRSGDDLFFIGSGGEDDGSEGSTATRNSLWRLPLDGSLSVPVEVSGMDTHAGSGFGNPMASSGFADDSNFYVLDEGPMTGDWHLCTFPFSGGSPTDPLLTITPGVANIVGPSVFSGASGSVRHWVGNDVSGGTFKQQIHRQVNLSTLAYSEAYNSAPAANGAYSTPIAVRSVSMADGLAGVYPHNGDPGSGTNMKILSPNGVSIDPYNANPDPRITLDTFGGFPCQWAWLYELTTSELPP